MKNKVNQAVVNPLKHRRKNSEKETLFVVFTLKNFKEVNSQLFFQKSKSHFNENFSYRRR